MTARIGYLSALAGDDGHAVLRPPRLVFGGGNFSDPEPGSLDEPGLANAPGFTDPPGLRDELTAQPDAAEARIVDAPSGQAVPETPSRRVPLPSLDLRPDFSLDPRPDFAGRVPQPGPPASASVPPGRPPAADDAVAGGRGDPGGQSGPSRASTPSAERNFLVGDPDDGVAGRSAVGRSAVGTRAQASPVEADGARHVVLERPPLMPGEPDGDGDGMAGAGHPLTSDPASAESSSVGHEPVRRVAGEPWRMPKPGQPWPGRRNTGALSAPPPSTVSPNTPSVTGVGPFAGPPPAALPAAAPSAGLPDRAAGPRSASTAV
ncbi:MAG: hypothetical protein ACRDOI_37850, partial [Trebonia sp.]